MDDGRMIEYVPVRKTLSNDRNQKDKRWRNRGCWWISTKM